MRWTASIPGIGEVLASLLRARERLVDEIRQFDRELKTISIGSPACHVLMRILGVGVQTSAAFAAAVDDASRFKLSRTAGAYFGLVPRRHQSGELDWSGRINKQGDGTIRKLLYEAANSILTRTRQTFALKSWGSRSPIDAACERPGSYSFAGLPSSCRSCCATGFCSKLEIR